MEGETMRKGKVVAMCPKCCRKDVFETVGVNRRLLKGEKYEIRICPFCGERYLAKTYGYNSILRFHGDDFMEQMESILEITPKHCENFIQQVKGCNETGELLRVVQSMHGDVKPMSTAEYEQMLDTSLLLTEDLYEQLTERE